VELGGAERVTLLRTASIIVNLRRLAPARGIVAALLVLVASFATSATSAVASQADHQDSALHSTTALHGPVVHRIADEQRSPRRVVPAADLPFVADARHLLAASQRSPRPTTVEHYIVARPVPRAYDATAPPRS
jgi:hypothetical protein